VLIVVVLRVAAVRMVTLRQFATGAEDSVEKDYAAKPAEPV
jgi:hypothetical protein